MLEKRELLVNDMSSSNQDPSDVLRFLNGTLPPDTFIKLLEKGLYPALDALPMAHKTTISKALTEIKHDSDKIQLKLAAIDYDVHKRSLDDTVRALYKSVKRDWKYGADPQGEMMLKIWQEVVRSLPTLWRIAVEDGLELELIRICLSLCTEAIKKAANWGSRTEFDIDIKVTITDSNNVKVYEEAYADIFHALSWMWKELLVVTSVQGSTTNAIESDIARLRYEDDVYGFIGKYEGDRHHTGRSLWDAHWTTAMKEAASRLLISRRAARIESFKKTPSFKVYTQLMEEYPDLKATLLEATRAAIFPSSPTSYPTITYGTAADIFNVDSHTDDLVRLLNDMSEYATSSDPTIGRAELTVVKHLSKLPSTVHHKAALDVIARRLDRVKSDTYEEIYGAFPGFEDAWDWLELQIEKGKMTPRVPWDETYSLGLTAADRQLRNQRDKCIDTFVRRAAETRDGRGYSGSVNDFDDPMDGIDPNDSDYEQQKNLRRPDLVKAVADWVLMLQEWPDKIEAGRVWDEVKESEAKGTSIFAVDGAAEQLASRCDWSWDHNGAK